MLDEYGRGKTTMPTKGYGRIYVENEEDVEKVKKIIKSMSSFEYDYLPEDLIAVFDGNKKTSFTYKFDEIDLNDLMMKCWKKGIHAFYMI